MSQACIYIVERLRHGGYVVGCRAFIERILCSEKLLDVCGRVLDAANGAILPPRLFHSMCLLLDTVNDPAALQGMCGSYSGLRADIEQVMCNVIAKPLASSVAAGSVDAGSVWKSICDNIKRVCPLPLDSAWLSTLSSLLVVVFSAKPCTAVVCFSPAHV